MGVLGEKTYGNNKEIIYNGLFLTQVDTFALLLWQLCRLCIPSL